MPGIDDQTIIKKIKRTKNERNNKGNLKDHTDEQWVEFSEKRENVTT